MTIPHLTQTKPKPRFPKDYKVDPHTLAVGRYGTLDMANIWGDEKTFEYSLHCQAQSSLLLSEEYPDIVPPEHASEIEAAATLKVIDPDRIRKIEADTGHDMIAINTSIEEKVSNAAASHVNKGKTSGDTTVNAQGLQIKESLEVIAGSVENLRDITIEKSLLWIDVPFMDTTHLYDAVPSVAGRAFAHYAEMLQSGLNLLRYVYDNSIIGKWGDMTGNHHSVNSLGIDGMALQELYCEGLGLGHMIASAQIPGLEFQADVVYVMARLGETINNLAKYVAWGRSDDVNVFVNLNPKKKKGSSTAPHKDAKNGNPTAEEQVMSVRNYLMGNMTTALANCELPYARNLAASSNSRINFEEGFKYLDHGIRRLGIIMHHLGIREERSEERVTRSYGVVTSPQVLTYLTDHRRANDPMTRSQAHDLLGTLATQAWDTQTNFTDVLLECPDVTSRLDSGTIREISDPMQYLGESKRIIQKVADKCYQEQTVGV